MNPLALGGLGLVLLGAIGVQQFNIQSLNEEKKSLSLSVSLLEETNAQQRAQHTLDLEDVNRRYVELIESQERERAMFSDREVAQQRVAKQLNTELDKLKFEVNNAVDESKCMRTRMPRYAISLLRTREDADDNNNKNGGKEGLPTKAVVKKLPSW